MGSIAILQENINSITETYDSLMTINTNNTLLWLTIFSGIMLPLTLITGMFGMNVPVPREDNHRAFWYITIGMLTVV